MRYIKLHLLPLFFVICVLSLPTDHKLKSSGNTNGYVGRSGFEFRLHHLLVG